MISTDEIRRLNELGLTAEQYRAVLSILASSRDADDKRREELRQKLEAKEIADAERRARNANRMRTVRAQNPHSARTVQQEIPPTPPKEIISNLLPFSMTPLKKEERSEIVALGDDDWPTDYRLKFWEAYPRKVGKAGALRVLERVCKGGKVKFPDLIAAVSRYREAGLEPQFVKHPETWLSKGCWEDQQEQHNGTPSFFNGQPARGSREDLRRRAVLAYDRLCEFGESGTDDEGGSGETGAASARGIPKLIGP